MTQRSAVTEPWGKPVNLETVNTSRYEGAPCLSPDGKWLFFTSNQSNSPSIWNYIMLSALGADGQWGRPRNMAREVDLPSNAGCPAVSPDGRTLYFMSDVPEGLGGSDVWEMNILPIVDLNWDGIVDAADMSIMIDHWGESETLFDIGPSPLGDGVIDTQDLIVLSEHLFSDLRLFVDDDSPNDPGPGDTLLSDPLEDGSAEHPFDAIQEAIDAAGKGQCVVVLPGTYTGNGNRDMGFRGKRITVRSTYLEDPAAVAMTVIDCEGSQAAPHRGFLFKDGESSLSVLAGLTITNGYQFYGGGVYCSGYSNPTISHCVFRNNRAGTGGGGIMNSSGSPIVANCVFFGNSTEKGAAIFNSSNLTVSNCTFSRNSATVGGGAVYTQVSNTTLTNCILWGNTPNEIDISGNGTVSIAYSDIQGGFTGEGNIVANPLFADPANGDYHLKSQAGRWDQLSESWVIDEVTSPCIDEGDPNSPVEDEPEPNGGQINMGAYGGTVEASMSLSTVAGN